MKPLLTLALLLFTSAVTYAQQSFPYDLALSWQNPSEYVDGTAIETGDLRGTVIACTRQSGEEVIREEIPGAEPGTAQSHTFVGAIPQPGTYTCYAFAVTVDDLFSDASNAAQRKYTGKPNPPIIVEIQ